MHVHLFPRTKYATTGETIRSLLSAVNVTHPIKFLIVEASICSFTLFLSSPSAVPFAANRANLLSPPRPPFCDRFRCESSPLFAPTGMCAHPKRVGETAALLVVAGVALSCVGFVDGLASGTPPKLDAGDACKNDNDNDERHERKDACICTGKWCQTSRAELRVHRAEEISFAVALAGEGK